MNAEQIAKALEKPRRSGSGWVACCPTHDDQNPSLSLRDGADGKVLVKDFGGCDNLTVIDELKARGLWPEREYREYPPEWGNLVLSYDYTDENGKLLYQVCRFEPKGFRPRRPDGAGGWRWGYGNVRRVLYHLPEVVEAAILFVTEGERDADALRDFGFCATTNSGGANSWRDEFNPFFRGKEVIILPDADGPGWTRALTIAKGLVGIASTIQLLELPGAKDAAEWLGQGRSELELIALVEGAANAV